MTRVDNRVVRFTCGISSWEQSFLFAENKHFGVPSTVKTSHALNSSMPGMSSIPLLLAHCCGLVIFILGSIPHQSIVSTSGS